MEVVLGVKNGGSVVCYHDSRRLLLLPADEVTFILLLPPLSDPHRQHLWPQAIALATITLHC